MIIGKPNLQILRDYLLLLVEKSVELQSFVSLSFLQFIAVVFANVTKEEEQDQTCLKQVQTCLKIEQSFQQ